jgi:hypothetical protein
MMTEVTISPELAYTAECVLRQFGWVAEADVLRKILSKPVQQEPIGFMHGGYFYYHNYPTDKSQLLPDGTQIYTHPAPADALDAARYRWLREKHNDQTSDFAVCDGHLIITHFGDLDLDAAIDAAIAAAKEEGNV